MPVWNPTGLGNIWPQLWGACNVRKESCCAECLDVIKLVPLQKSDSSNFLSQAGAQIPKLYGSKQDVPAQNFFYVNLASFIFYPLDPNYPTPTGWNGKLSIIFMLQDGPAFSSAQAYITQQPLISPATAVAG